MRRLNQLRDEEDGAVTVAVAALMVVLLGCAAIAVDVGAIYAERAQLQNGADAAALAVAQDCAGGGCGDAFATAQALADGNANDSSSGIASVVVGAGTATVRTTAEDTTGTIGLGLFFARSFGLETTNVSAEATAAWGFPAAGSSVLPLAFAPCEFNLDGEPQVLASHGGTDCTSTSPSGAVLPGGFAWLESSGGGCSADVDIDDPEVEGSPGTSLPSECEAVLESLKNTTAILPVYEDMGGTGGGWYQIKGWAAFHITGWRFPGNSWNNTGTPGCTGSCQGLIGTFIEFTSFEDGFTTGGPDLGAPIISLIE